MYFDEFVHDLIIDGILYTYGPLRKIMTIKNKSNWHDKCINTFI